GGGGSSAQTDADARGVSARGLQLGAHNLQITQVSVASRTLHGSFRADAVDGYAQVWAASLHRPACQRRSSIQLTKRSAPCNCLFQPFPPVSCLWVRERRSRGGS